MKLRFERYRPEILDVWVGMIRVARIWRADTRMGHTVTYATNLELNWTLTEWVSIKDEISRKAVALDVAQRISS